MGNKPKSAQDEAVSRKPDKSHLDDLLDAALAGTFPASDPVSGLVSDETSPASGAARGDGGPACDEGEEKPDQ
jgi:hypothetical protein